MSQSLVSPPDPFLINPFVKQVFRGFQWSKNFFGIAHKTLNTRLLSTLWPVEPKGKALAPELLAWIQTRFEELIETDWQDAEQGVYPASLLFENSWDEFFRFYPSLWLDSPLIWQRADRQQHQDFDPEISLEGYPQYYVQNFHHQTNGYLSDQSANLYDLQVEILFGGSADAMRRRILAPLKQALTGRSSPPRILDLACGTGRTLKLLRASFPQAALFGTDLSPTYLRKAMQFLSQTPGELPQLVQGNAEQLPYRENFFDAVTSVFLFHELPAPIRQRVIEQAWRVLRPGGTMVICDSIQAIDTPEALPMMVNFPAMFHEPYYRHYITDDLGDRLHQAGFERIQTQQHFMSKYWVAYKPV